MKTAFMNELVNLKTFIDPVQPRYRIEDNFLFPF